MSDNWVLYYWGPGFPGRGEFVRLLFEDAGVPYTEVNDPSVIRDKIINGNTDNYPAFAPPLVKNGSFELSQCPAVCRYLGGKFNMVPDDEADRAHADQVSETCHDYIAEGRLAFHGKVNIASYFDQVEETQPYIDRFIKDRLPRWLKHLEQLVASSGENQYLFGSKVTYADLALLHVLRATEAQFPDPWKAADYIPKLKAFKDRVSQRPNLVKYFKSDRCKPFSGNSMM